MAERPLYIYSTRDDIFYPATQREIDLLCAYRDAYEELANIKSKQRVLASRLEIIQSNTASLYR